jgi:flagellar protein FlaG
MSAAQAQKNAIPVREHAALAGVQEVSKSSENEKNSALAEINQSLVLSSIGVRFEFDKESNTLVTKVMDVESGELIRQMPSEEVVRISRALGKLQGLLVSQKA